MVFIAAAAVVLLVELIVKINEKTGTGRLWSLMRHERFKLAVIFVLATASIILPVLVVEYTWRMHTGSREYSEPWSLVRSWLELSSIVIPAIVIISLVKRCFGVRYGRKTKLAFIILTYSYIVLNFSGLYYFFTCYEDHLDAVEKYYAYNTLQENFEGKKDSIESSSLRIRDSRAFAGMSRRMWSGVDYIKPGGNQHYRFDDKGIEQYFLGKTDSVPMKYIFERAKLPEKEVVRFIPESRLPVYADCLHLSLTTIATVGYGNISPASMEARIAANIEVVLGQALIVLALGMLFAGWQRT